MYIKKKKKKNCPGTPDLLYDCTTLVRKNKKEICICYTQNSEETDTNTIQHASKKMSELAILLHIFTLRKIHVIQLNKQIMD